MISSRTIDYLYNPPLGEITPERPVTAQLHYGVDILTNPTIVSPGSAHLICTSPPYWGGQRDYEDDDQIGTEGTVKEYVEKLVQVGRWVWDVLRPEGTFWLNLGDKYVGKKLQGVPWKVAFALIESGWVLRNEIIWHKTNPMPDGAVDRCTVAHEHIFLFTKQPDGYFYNNYGIREKAKFKGFSQAPPKPYTAGGAVHHGVGSKSLHERNPDGRNLLTIWNISTVPSKTGHFAVWPPELVERIILLGVSIGCCPQCNAPWHQIELEKSKTQRLDGRETLARLGKGRMIWQQGCSCPPENPGPCVIVDPFSGSGTTGMVALGKGHHYIGIDLQDSYLEGACGRVQGLSSLQNTSVPEESLVWED